MATGIIKPKTGAEVRVGSQASGIVRRLRVAIGDKVRRGDVLALLDQAEYQARLLKSSTELDTRKASLAYLRSVSARQEQLFAQQVIPQAEIDLARRELAVGEAQCRQAEAMVRDDSIQLARTALRAPINGVVAAISTQEGETVSAALSAPTFVTILDLNRLEVWAYVDETDIGRIAVGQKASFTVDTYPDTEFSAHITAIYPKPVIQENVVDYIAVLSFVAPAGKTLRPEMTTTVRIAQDRRTGVLAIPSTSIRRDAGAPYVLVVHGDNADRRPITTGLHDRSHTEITSGLAEGDILLGPEPSENDREKP